MPESTETKRQPYGYFHTITTRWHDNDLYGHVNNVVYYGFFDTTVNKYLIEAGLDIHRGEQIAFVVNSQCSYYQPVAYPEVIDVGMAVKKLGNSSVTYQLAIFKHETQECCASGTFTHVFVERATNRSTPIPSVIRAALQRLELPS